MFKNLIMYRLTGEYLSCAETLAERLGEFKLTPCSNLEVKKLGWVKPAGKFGGSLVFNTNGNLMVKMGISEKILPASVVEDELNARIDALELGRDIKKKEREELKDEVLHDLLPRAFVRHSSVSAYISTKLNVIFVDSTSHGKAEDLLALLRKSIGSLSVLPVQTKTPVDQMMTKWVDDMSNVLPFEVLDGFELKSPLEKGPVIQAKNRHVTCSESQEFIGDGMFVTKLNLQHGESVTFTLNENLTIGRIKFTDVVLEQNDIETSDKLGHFNADFLIMTGVFEQLFTDLMKVLGGEDNTTVDTYVDSAIEHVKEKLIDELTGPLNVNSAPRVMKPLEQLGVLSTVNNSGSRKVLV